MKLHVYLFLLVTSIFLSSCQKADGGFAPSVDSEPPVTAALVISPVSVTLAVSNTQTFLATGGAGPYTFSIFTGSGSILSSTGNFTAPGASGSTVVRVTDSQGRFADAVVTINPALQISPTNPSLTINQTQNFTVAGGVSPFTYSVSSGVGSVNASSGVYTAPATPGSAVVRVTDARGNISDAAVNIFGNLGISPSSTTLAVNNTRSFTAAGGSSPYTYSIASGTGSVNPSTGLYTAPGSSGSAVVRVTDSLGATADSSVTINSELTISPTSQTTLINSTISFTDSGGVPPFTYSIVSGTGSINATTGVYTAPASNGSAVVRVTDAIGNTASANVTVTTTLNISPTTVTLAVNNTRTFSAVGGTGPYSFSRVSGTGSINSTTGVYTAPATAGSAVVRVTDSLGATADASITVNAALAISPTSQTMGIDGTLNFSATDGVVPYTYSIFSGSGTVGPSTGLFTAPSSPGTTVVRVTDSIGNFTDSTVTVTSGLSISPASTSLAVNNTVTFTASNGATPYTYSIVSGGGTINSSTGFYTAPSTQGSAVVRVTSNLGATADATVTINAALAISPATKTLAINNVFTFTATGGVSPYSYSIVSGGGTINSSSGAYTAPATAGSATVRVTDGLGNTSNATVTINAALAISPASATISSTGTQAYSASGGVSPYSYSIASGPGSINATSGLYSGTSAGSVTIRVTDSLGNISNGVLTVNGPLSVSPSSGYVVTESDLSLTAVGGVAPYTFSIVSGGGIIDSVTGEYTAPATTGSVVLRTTDSASATFNTNLTIYNSLALSPLEVTVATGDPITFTATGGVGTRTFSVYSGAGTINSSTGNYVAPPVAGTDIIRVIDTIGNIVEAEVTVVSELSITPPTLKLPVFSTKTFSAILGAAPYTYSIFSGTGTVNSSTGLYTAPGNIGLGSVRVTDSITNTADAAITHIEPVQISVGSYHTCVRYNEGSVKCFGDGAFGQLGNGSTSDLADSPNELGGNLPFVNLGTGRTATSIATGISHSCALLDNGTVKCWGHNAYGQLGLGDTANRGDGASEMGNNLPTINLGVGRTATAIFAFGYVSCAKLDNAVTKCWGRNSSGQLGLDDTVNRGTASSQMGDNLPAADLGSGRTVIKMVGGLDFTCALLDNATVKCFGGSRYGQLGQGNNLTLGDSAGEMAALSPVNVGTGRTVVGLGGGYSHACAILDNGSTKCWGRNFRGQLGHESNTNQWGTGSSHMGDNLPVTPLTNFTSAKIYGGNQMTCAINSAGGVRCWGQAGQGQLLNGGTSNIGDGNNEISSLVDLNFGTGVVASSIDVGFYHACALMTNKRIKCWGGASNGALGSGNTSPNIGDNAGENGDNLSYVNH